MLYQVVTPIIQPRMRFFDADGKPLVGGKVYSFKVGTTQFKPTYRDANKTALNTNPIVLDADGSALIYLNGAHVLKVYDRDGNLIESRYVPETQMRTQFFDKYGVPLKNGKVWTYDIASTIKKTSYANADKNQPNANPVVLDAEGWASISMLGSYRLRSYNEKGVSTGDQDFRRPVAKALTSRIYPFYFEVGVSSSVALNDAMALPLNSNRFEESTNVSALVESASIWNTNNIAYMPQDSCFSSAGIEFAAMWSVIQVGHMPFEGCVPSASILSASIHNAVITHIKKPENLSSSAQLIGAQIENQDLNPTPRNIKYIVDGDVDFTFDADGVGYTYNYYRSPTPMNVASLPTPIATGLTTKAYTDTSALSSDFYVRFSANKASSEHVSSESLIVVGDPLDAYVVALLRFKNDFTDEKGNIWAARNANTYVSDEVLHVDATGGGLLCTDTNFLNFGGGAFCFETLIEMDAASLSPDILRNNWTAWQVNSAILNIESQKMRYVIFGPPVVLSTQTMTPGTLYHLVWARDAGGMMRLFLDGVLLRVDNYPTAVNFSYWGATLFQTGLVKCKGVRITKSHARYTANFVPPTHF